MDSYEVIHTLSNVNFSAYTYYQVYVDGGASLVYKSNTIAPTNTIVLNLAVCSSSDIAGSAGDIAFLGKKRPELTASYNSDGTWNIR